MLLVRSLSQLCLPQGSIAGYGILAVEIEDLRARLGVVDPVGFEELGECEWFVGIGGKGGVGRGDYADDEGDCSAAGLCGTKVSAGKCGGAGDIRVGGEAMMRGGVERMRWRARARRGTVEGDSAGGEQGERGDLE